MPSSILQAYTLPQPTLYAILETETLLATKLLSKLIKRNKRPMQEHILAKTVTAVRLKQSVKPTVRTDSHLITRLHTSPFYPIIALAFQPM